MMKVREMILSASMPSSMAILRFWAVARIALPILVQRMNNVRPTMAHRLVAMMSRSLEPIMSATGSRNSNSGISWGKLTKSAVCASIT